MSRLLGEQPHPNKGSSKKGPYRNLSGTVFYMRPYIGFLALALGMLQVDGKQAPRAAAVEEKDILPAIKIALAA